MEKIFQEFSNPLLRKNVCILSISGTFLPAFGLNTEIYSVNLRIKSEYGKYGLEKLRIRTLFM